MGAYTYSSQRSEAVINGQEGNELQKKSEKAWGWGRAQIKSSHARWGLGLGSRSGVHTHRGVLEGRQGNVLLTGQEFRVKVGDCRWLRKEAE